MERMRKKASRQHHWFTQQADQRMGAMSMEDDLQDLVSKAMRKAWQLGQTYWQQSDSNYESQWKKSSETHAKFDQLVDDTRAAITKATGSLT
jgi:hypothetical protein